MRSTPPEIIHSILFDREKCVACVACSKACPTRAIRVRQGAVLLKPELCIDCGACIRACPHDAVTARTSSPSDLKKFRCTVAIPSTTFFSQFGPDARPAQVAHALTRVGFDAYYDLSWMCEMVGRAVDTYLSDCKGPWPKISVTCPAIIRLIQIRYPDLLAHLVPIETPRELSAKLIRRKLAQERGLPPKDIGVFYTTPCSAIMESILSPVGLAESYFDGAFSIAELYGPLRKALRTGGGPAAEPSFSPKGLGWAIAGGESAMMRSTSTLAVSGMRDVTYVFDRIESGKFLSVDFIEAYGCPDGCVSGPLLIEGRYAAKRTMQRIIGTLGLPNPVKEEKVRSMFREHFFDLEDEVKAREIKPLTRDLRQAVRLKQEKAELMARLPGKDCAACGSPDCETLAADILAGEAAEEDCVFVRLEQLAGPGGQRRGAARARKAGGGAGRKAEP